MTANTRQLLIVATAGFRIDCIGDTTASGISRSASDQAVMDAYLGSMNRNAYESRFANAPEFYAVLATAEYHEHWARRMDIIAAPASRVTACPRAEVCGMVLPDLLKVSL